MDIRKSTPKKYHDYKRDAFNITPYRDKKFPQLKFEVRFKVDRKFVRRFFKSEREAKTYVELRRIELHNQGTEGMMFPADLRVMAQRADAELKVFGKSIADAVEHYLRHLRTERGSIPVRQAVDELLANRRAAGLSAVYLRDLKYRLGKFAESFRERSIASIGTREIVSWLESLGVSAVTRNTFRRDVRTLYSYAGEHGYCAENPVASKATLAKERRRDVQVLSVEGAQQLLKTSSPEMLPYWAIGLFGGLRPSELRGLQWSDVDFDVALITVRSGKTGRKRFVHMQPNLLTWLNPYRFQKHEGKVVDPVNFRRQYAEDRDAAGLTEWPVNALRHSFGSYWLAQFGDIGRLALEMGNSPEVIEAHYKQAVRRTEAKRYWAILPFGGKVIAATERQVTA